MLALSACFMSIALSCAVGHRARAWFDPADDQAALHPSTLSSRAEPGASTSVFSTSEARERAAERWSDTQASRLASRAEPHGSTAAPVATDARLTSRRLRLYDVNAERELSVAPFRHDGARDERAFDALRGFMRCRRSGQETEMSPQLISLLLRISEHFGEPVLHMISAHRYVDDVVTQRTSQHARGTASDIRIPGVSVEVLGAAARAVGAGGVGVYARHRFVHVDVREKPYFWRESETNEDAVDDAADRALAPRPAVEAEAAPENEAESLEAAL